MFMISKLMYYWQRREIYLKRNCEIQTHGIKAQELPYCTELHKKNTQNQPNKKAPNCFIGVLAFMLVDWSRI